jgi:TM2 domain-containing membrane protein YozV
MGDTTAPPGWYGQQDGSERFWTGSQWSDQVRPRGAAPPPLGQLGPVVSVPAPWNGATEPSRALAPAARTGSLSSPRLAYTQQGYVAVTQVAPKSPALALLGSFFVPGLGQLMNGAAGKGVLMFLAYVISLVLILAFIGLFLAPAVWIWSMVDAYGGARQWNATHGILS